MKQNPFLPVRDKKFKELLNQSGPDAKNEMLQICCIPVKNMFPGSLIWLGFLSRDNASGPDSLGKNPPPKFQDLVPIQ